MITCLVQSNLINYHKAKATFQAAQNVGCNAIELVIDPETKDLMYDLPSLEGFAIPFGSTALKKLAGKYSWQGLFFNEDTFRIDESIKHHGMNMLNYDSTIWDIAKISTIGLSVEKVHVRPVEDNKMFTGRVMNFDELCNLIRKHDKGLICVSDVKTILAEYRFFIVGGKIIDGSSYIVDENLNTKGTISDELYSFAQQLADHWLPHETVVMDIANTPEGFKIIEFNCLNFSGIYNHDMNKIIRALDEYYG